MRKHVKARRQKLRELAAKDAARRCHYCKIALPPVTWADHIGHVFCSLECRETDTEMQLKAWRF